MASSPSALAFRLAVRQRASFVSGSTSVLTRRVLSRYGDGSRRHYDVRDVRDIIGTLKGSRRVAAEESEHKAVPSSSSLEAKSSWWGSGGDNGGDKDSTGGAAGAAASGGGGSDDESDGNESDDGSSSKDDEPPAIIFPSRLDVGDEAPRYPHLLGLPLTSRPLFPGIVTSVTVTDPATIAALEQNSGVGGGDGGGSGRYLATFLRTTSATTPLDVPEVITDPSQLHTVGTFAQVFRITKAGGKGTDASEAGGMSGWPAATTAAAEGSTENGAKSTDDASEEPLSALKDAASVLLLAHRRVDLLSVDELGPPLDVTVRHWDRLDYHYGSTDSKVHDTVRALTNEVLSTIREVAQINPLFRETVAMHQTTRVNVNDPYRLADFAASITTGSADDLQAVLEERHFEARLQKALVLLRKEKEVSLLQQEISAKVEEKMTEAQRKYFLMEQLKSIKKELGMERDDKEALLEKYRQQLKEYPSIPPDIQEVIDGELEKLSSLEKNSSEFNVTRSYLDWLTAVPWGVVTPENFDLRTAQRVLNRDHYGLEEVKETILQFIAVGKLRGTVQGKILCLAGPPGTGKTSIAQSVAAALGRPFYRFSVGGLSDVSEIKGHRRTYIGAMPGKVIQCLSSTKSSNPLVLIDEVDKLGRDYRGDPASALLEVLDPNQNSTFRDHFLDVPVDISKVLFMCTANDIERIPGPLLDRMEVIRLSGYDMPEKVEIAQQYLVPKSMKESGLMIDPQEVDKEQEEEGGGGGEGEGGEAADGAAATAENPNEASDVDAAKSPLEAYQIAPNVPPDLKLERSAIEALVRKYAREAGVRNLAKHIDRVTRKLALQVVAEEEGTELTAKTKRKADTWQVTDENLHEYVGKPIFTKDRLYESDPLPNGIVMGLAWTSMGGSALYVEAQAIQRGNRSGGGGGKDGEKEQGGSSAPRPGGSLKVTGQLGNVMNESTQIAYTVARAWLLGHVREEQSTGQEERFFFDDNDIHVHVPEGATPKDGPSAGVTLTTALLSLALGRPVRNDLAMSGELSLTGKVLPVGGIKEKTMAARRAGVTTLVFPADNRRDFEDCPEYLQEGLTVHFAEDYAQVFAVAFGSDGTNNNNNDADGDGGTQKN